MRFSAGSFLDFSVEIEYLSLTAKQTITEREIGVFLGTGVTLP